MKKDLTVTDRPGGRKEYSLHSQKLGKDLVYVSPIGEGGVARTFKFEERGSHGRYWVVKEYPKPDDEVVRQAQINIKNNLKALISLPVRNVDDIMVPPIEVLDFPKSGTFGYIMPYVDLSRFLSVSKLLKSNQFPDAEILCKMGKNLSSFFVQLNLGSGKCYKDINEGNIYLNPVTGEVRVIDNDNVGAPDIKTIQGTSQYRAPEIFTHQVLPDRYTDRFQLASYLLRLFVGAFPMEGRFMIDYCKTHGSIYDNDVARVVLGEKAVFVFDEQNTFNALPAAGEAYKIQRELWKRLPPELKGGLTKTFVDGLAHPNREKRTTPTEWVKIFDSLSRSLVRCSGTGTSRGCGKWTFGSADVCQYCGKKIPKEPCVNCHQLTPKEVDRCVRCGKPHRQQHSTEIRCPSCGSGNPETADICRNCGNYMYTKCTKCGEQVPVTEKNCPSCGNPSLWQKCGNPSCAKWYPQAMTICPICRFDPTRGATCTQCGRRVVPGTSVCPQCGNPVQVVSPVKKPQVTPQPVPVPPVPSPVVPPVAPVQKPAGTTSGWTIGRTELSLPYIVRTLDAHSHQGTLNYTVGKPTVIRACDLNKALPDKPLFCLFAKLDAKILGLQNLTGQPISIYRLKGDTRVPVETINPKETKEIAADDMIKFADLTLWIQKLVVTRP